MKKQITVLLATTLLLTSLTGCTNENSSTDDSSSVVDTSNSIASDNTESTESGTSAETSDPTQSLPEGVDIGNGMILTGTLLEHSQLEEFSVEPFISNYDLSEDEKKLLDSIGIPEIKDFYITAMALSTAISSTENITPTSAVTENNRTPANIENTWSGKRYFESGYTYDSFYNAFLNVFTKEGADELFKRYDYFLNYNGALLCELISKGGNAWKVHSEYELVSKTDTAVKFREMTFSHDKNSKPATEYKPELRYQYDITFTEYEFVLTESGWRAKLPDIFGISDISGLEENYKLVEVFGDDMTFPIVDITPENSWLADSFMATAEIHGLKILNPDGTELDPSLAIKASGSKYNVGTLMFDFAYIAYSKSALITSVDNPEVFSEDNLYEYESETKPDKKDYIKIKAGDILQNGLKVKEAYYVQDTSMGDFGDYLNSVKVKTEGELTLNGVLIRASKQEDIMSPYQEGQIYFIPYGADVPVHDITIHSHYIDSVTENFKAVSDAPLFRVGEIDEMPQKMLDDLDKFFKDSDVVKARVTIKDLVMGYALGANSHYYADLVSFEKHDW